MDARETFFTSSPRGPSEILTLDSATRGKEEPRRRRAKQTAVSQGGESESGLAGESTAPAARSQRLRKHEQRFGSFGAELITTDAVGRLCFPDAVTTG